MLEIVCLEPGHQPPIENRDRWVLIEAGRSGQFHGTGAGLKPSGDPVFYLSQAESDVSLEAALAAAWKWSQRHGVETIYVQPEPWE